MTDQHPASRYRRTLNEIDRLVNEMLVQPGQHTTEPSYGDLAELRGDPPIVRFHGNLRCPGWLIVTALNESDADDIFDLRMNTDLGSDHDDIRRDNTYDCYLYDNFATEY